MTKRSYLMALVLCSFTLLSCGGNIADESKGNEQYITGYGLGESRSRKFALISAKNYALGSLIQQIAGMDFVYRKAEGYIGFKSRARATIKHSDTVQHVYDLPARRKGRHRIFVVLVLKRKLLLLPKKDKVYCKAVKMTIITEREFVDIHHKIIKQIIDEDFPGIQRLAGKVYIFNLKVSRSKGSGRLILSARYCLIPKS